MNIVNLLHLHKFIYTVITSDPVQLFVTIKGIKNTSIPKGVEERGEKKKERGGGGREKEKGA